PKSESTLDLCTRMAGDGDLRRNLRLRGVWTLRNFAKRMRDSSPHVALGAVAKAKTMNEQSIFTAALELDPAERQRFLDEACGNDPGLRQRVERLIASHEAAASFMDQPAGRLAHTVHQPVIAEPG